MNMASFILIMRILWTFVESLWRCVWPQKPKCVARSVVVVAGASGGIGSKIAMLFAKLDCKVALWDINQQANVRTASRMTEIGCAARAYACDVTDAASVKRAANETRRDFGEPDILVNSAGVLVCKDILSLTENEFRKTLDVNTVAHFLTIKELLPAMLSRNSGHIVTIASMVAKIATPLVTDYCASKYAVDGLTDALEAEIRVHYKKSGINFTTVYPGLTGTNLVMSLSDRIEVGRQGEKLYDPEDVAQAVVDGVLRNQRYVFFRKKYRRLVFLLGFLPRKGIILFVKEFTAFRARSA